MPATKKKIYFNDDTYEWLLALTNNRAINVNSTLQEYTANNVLRDIQTKIEFMRNKQ